MGDKVHKQITFNARELADKLQALIKENPSINFDVVIEDVSVVSNGGINDEKDGMRASRTFSRELRVHTDGLRFSALKRELLLARK